MSKQKKKLVEKLCENIVTSHERSDWNSAADACIEDMENIASLSVLPGISEIAAEHELGFYPASLLYHSKNIPDDKE